MKPKLALLTFTITLLAAAHPTNALLLSDDQELAAGAVRGEVRDARTQKPLPGVSLVLYDSGEVVARTMSGVDGSFLLAFVPEGLYRLEARARGLQTASQADVRVVAAKTSVTDFELLPADAITESVVVTAKASPEDPRAPVTISYQSREEIRRSPGTAGDVLRALDSLPGVNATGEFSSFTVRGRGPRDNLILVDGIPFDKVTHFDQSIGEQEDIDGGGRFSIFAPNLIQEIEFLPGGFPAAYGGKNASLLRLTVARGNRVTPAVSGRVEITGWEINYDGPSYLEDDTSLLLSARGQYFERLFELVGEADIGSPTLYDLIAKSSSRIGARHRLSVLGVFAPEDFVRDVDNVLASEDFDDTALARTEQDSGLLGATWRYLPDRGFLSNTLFFRSSDKRSVQGEAFPELIDGELPSPELVPVREGILDITEAETEIGWRGDFSTESGGGFLSAGGRLTRVELDYAIRLDGDWIRYVYDRDDYRPDPDQKYIVLTPERIDSSFRSDAWRAAAYSDYSFDLGERLTLTPGLRYDYDGFAEESLISPRLNASVVVDPRTRLNFATGVYYQYPRFLEIVADPGNADLGNERSLQATLGLSRYLRDDLRLSAEAYYQALDNLVVVPDRTTGAAANLGEGTAWGVDLALVKRLRDRWYGQIGYSYAVSERDDNLGEGRYEADFNRPHTFNVLAAWELGASWSLSAKWRYASGRPTDAFIVNADVFDDPEFVRFSKEITATNALRLPDFHTLNVRVDYRRRVGPVSLITFVDFFNLYDHKNVDSFQWLERKGENKPEGLEAFPTFGIKLEF